MKDRLTVLTGDALTQLRTLEPESVQCCVTSPPYWGLRDYGVAGQLGLEKTPDEYVAKLVQIFREVSRVLKNDGTLWLNIGDSYFGSWGNYGSRPELDAKTQNQRSKESDYIPRGGWDKRRERPPSSFPIHGLKPKDLVGIPWMVAFALRADGWWLRSDIIWAKANCMPESVTDRPTRSHEYLFLLTKSAKYFYNADAIKEPASESDWELRAGRGNLDHKLIPSANQDEAVKYTRNHKRPHHSTLTGGLYVRHHLGDEIPEKERRPDKQRGHSRRHDGFNDRWDQMEREEQFSGTRNKRDVWTVAPANFPEAHFATYPPDLIKPCILAGSRPQDTILDPFAGSGTTGLVAIELARAAILIELNPTYVQLIHQRCNVTPGFI